MPSNMLHSVIPAVRSREILPAKSTGALLWRLALLVPAAGADVLETGFKCLPFRLGGIRPGRMNPALVLSEEILTVEDSVLVGGLDVVVAGGS
jgi:hypothetical protein